MIFQSAPPARLFGIDLGSPPAVRRLMKRVRSAADGSERVCLSLADPAASDQAGRDAFFPLGERDRFLDDPGGRTYGGGSCPSYLSRMRSYFTPC
jgi:hypothetical protein